MVREGSVVLAKKIVFWLRFCGANKMSFPLFCNTLNAELPRATQKENTLNMC